MAALDDIYGEYGAPSIGKKLMVSPPPIDASLQGAPNPVSSRPTSEPQHVSSQQTGNKPANKQQSYSGNQRITVTGISGAPITIGQRTENPMSYVEMFEMMNPDKPETPEERAKREKKEKREAILAAVGDGISALSNLFFTSQYAPNAYDPYRGMSATSKARWEKLRQEREAKRRAYNDGYLRALAMDRAEGKDERSWRHTIEREKISDERYEIKAAQDKALADLNEKLKKQQITGAEYDTKLKQIKAQYAPQQEEADLKRKNTQISASHASAEASKARAGYYQNKVSGGGSGQNKKPTLTIGRKTYTYDSKDDYERAVERYVEEYGISPYIAYPDGKDNRKRAKYTTKRKSIAQLAAEVEIKSKAQKDEFSEYEVTGEEEDFSQYEQ